MWLILKICLIFITIKVHRLRIRLYYCNIYYNIVLFFSGAARKTGPRGGGAIFEGFPPRSCGSCARVS